MTPEHLLAAVVIFLAVAVSIGLIEKRAYERGFRNGRESSRKDHRRQQPRTIYRTRK